MNKLKLEKVEWPNLTYKVLLLIRFFHKLRSVLPVHNNLEAGQRIKVALRFHTQLTGNGLLRHGLVFLIFIFSTVLKEEEKIGYSIKFDHESEIEKKSMLSLKRRFVLLTNKGNRKHQWHSRNSNTPT